MILLLLQQTFFFAALPIKENNKGNQICVDRGIMLQRNVTLGNCRYSTIVDYLNFLYVEFSLNVTCTSFFVCFILWLVEHSNIPVEKNITLERPSNVELICQFTPSGDLNSVNVTWKKGDKLLEDNYLVNATGGILYTQYR